MAEDKRESGFVIDGESYAIPTLDSLDLDEERLLYLYADCVVQDFVPVHPDWDEETKKAHEFMLAQRVRNPSLKRALALIAYRRKHPDVDEDLMLNAIGRVNALTLDIAMLDPGDEDPMKVSQTEPERTSERSEPASSTDSGRPTETSSDQVAASPETTGITGSATSSPQLRAIG